MLDSGARISVHTSFSCIAFLCLQHHLVLTHTGLPEFLLLWHHPVAVKRMYSFYKSSIYLLQKVRQHLSWFFQGSTSHMSSSIGTGLKRLHSRLAYMGRPGQQHGTSHMP